MVAFRVFALVSRLSDELLDGVGPKLVDLSVGRWWKPLRRRRGDGAAAIRTRPRGAVALLCAELSLALLRRQREVQHETNTSNGHESIEQPLPSRRGRDHARFGHKIVAVMVDDSDDT